MSTPSTRAAAAPRGHTAAPEVAPEAVPEAALPLAGARAHALGDTVALRVAVARLRALGCVAEGPGGPAPPGAPAGWIGLTRLPFAADGPLPECRIDWSGPVTLPMAGELDVQAVCGIAHVHGRAAGEPRTLGVDYASVCAGVLAAQSVTAAALALARGGQTLSAATSVAQAALLALTQYVAAATAPGGEPEPDAPPPAAGRVPPFRSADGALFEIDTLDAEAWWSFWTSLGTAPAPAAAGWPPFQRRFATATCRLPQELGDTVAALDYARVRGAAHASGVSVVPVRGADAPRDPAPASPWRLRGHAPAGPVPPLPVLGPRERAPLAGLRVVEATTRVQGPLTGHLLGLLGAEVVRLEPPGGDPMRGVPPMAGALSARFLGLNRGKRAVEADLKSERGRRTALDLAASAHVFLHNWPPGRAERLGLGHGALTADHPCLVHVHTGGWATALPDPQPLGTDYLVQAHSGVAALVNGPGEPPAPSLMTVTDVLGGILGAEGAVAALLARARTGAGVRVGTALVDAARLIRDTARTSGPGLERSERSDGDAAAADPATAANTTTDLAEMAADPAFGAAFDTDGAAYVRAPWTFAPTPTRTREESR